MGEGIDPALGIIFDFITDSINHSGSSCRGCDLPRVKYIERKGVVGLVAGFIGHAAGGRKAELFCDRGGYLPVVVEGVFHRGKDILGETEVLQERLADGLIFEIVENAFGKAGC